MFHDPCLGHLPEVIADRPLRNLQLASDIWRGHDPVDLEQAEDLFLEFRQLGSQPDDVEPAWRFCC